MRRLSRYVKWYNSCRASREHLYQQIKHHFTTQKQANVIS